MRLARNRWYSREGQHDLRQRAHRESTGTRKIISLTLLLLMVMILMQQLRNPKKYEAAFKAIGLTKPDPASNLSDPVRKSLDLESPSIETNKALSSFASDSLDAQFPRTTYWLTGEGEQVDRFMQMWQRLLESASPKVIEELAKNEFFAKFPNENAAKANEPASVRLSTSALEWIERAQARIDSWATEYQLSLNSVPSESNTNRDDIELGKSFLRQWTAWTELQRKSVQGASSALDPEVRLGLRLALDRRLLMSLRDAVPWRTQERLAFARTFQRASVLSSEIDNHRKQNDHRSFAAPLVEVPPLIKQSDEYRGQVVRLHGRPVTNAVPIVQEVDSWGRFQYDVVWLRPVDISQQPVCIYALRKPHGGWPRSPVDDSSNKNSETPRSKDYSSDDIPLAEFTGIYVKQRAYPSNRGVDVAPVLIAFDVRWLDNSTDAATQTSLVYSKPPRFRRWVEPGEQTANLNLLRDILASQLDSLADEETHTLLTEEKISTDIAAKKPALAHVLYQLPRIERPLSAAILTDRSIGPAKLGVLQGWVREIDSIRISQPNGPAEERTIHRLKIEPVGRSIEQVRACYVFVNEVPTEWRNHPNLSQPVSVPGLLLETSSKTSAKECWLADHVNWSWPWLAMDQLSKVDDVVAADQVNDQSEFKHDLILEPSIPEDWRDLAATGFDLSRVDLLRRLRGQAIHSQESHAFFSLIESAGRLVNRNESSSMAPLTAIECLQDSPSPTLRRVRAKVEIVRITRILVSDELHRAALGADSYFELDGLADIGNQAIQMLSADGQEKLSFQGEYPITLVSKEIPAWLMTTSNINSSTSHSIPAEDDSLNDPGPTVWYPRISADIDGIFYRLWSFSTAQTSEANRQMNESTSDRTRLQQIGPLIAVTDWRLPRPISPSSNGYTMVSILLVAILITAVVIWGYRRLGKTGSTPDSTRA